MDKRIGLVLAISAALGIGADNQVLPRKQIIKKSLAELNKAKGLKEFFYGPDSVWAINQKNADIKAKRNNWIK